MLNNVVKSLPLRIFLLTYLAMMLVMFPVSRMYANEYISIPIKFEFAFLMVITALISNAGILLTLSEWGLKHKKTTYVGLVFTALINALLFVMTNGNPFQLISSEYWNTIRYLCFYAVFVISAILCFFVRGCQYDH